MGLVLHSLVTLMAVTATALAPVVTHTPEPPALLSVVVSTMLVVPSTTRRTRVSKYLVQRAIGLDMSFADAAGGGGVSETGDATGGRA